ncbi:MAG: ABC transporter ATP-binding protein [Candidatus Eisenbacteria bacterium]
MIRLVEIRKAFRNDFLRRKREVLRGLSFHVRRGETYALLGENGAGKTTTMKILLGLIRPDGGTAVVDGVPASVPRARARVGFLPEHPYFFPHLTGEELVRYYGRLSGLSAAEASAAADRQLGRVRLGSARARRIRTYSKGMLQRLGFAQALVADPEVLVLDEPLSGLDPVGRKEMRDLLLDLKRAGKSVFFSSHIIEDVERLADRAGFLTDGRIGLEADGEGKKWIEVLAVGIDADASLAGDLEAERIVREGERLLISVRTEKELPRLGERVRARGGRIVRVEKRRETLEDLFVLNILSRPGARDPV